MLLFMLLIRDALELNVWFLINPKCWALQSSKLHVLLVVLYYVSLTNMRQGAKQGIKV